MNSILNTNKFKLKFTFIFMINLEFKLDSNKFSPGESLDGEVLLSSEKNIITPYFDVRFIGQEYVSTKAKYEVEYTETSESSEYSPGESSSGSVYSPDRGSPGHYTTLTRTETKTRIETSTFWGTDTIAREYINLFKILKEQGFVFPEVDDVESSMFLNLFNAFKFLREPSNLNLIPEGTYKIPFVFKLPKKLPLSKDYFKKVSSSSLAVGERRVEQDTISYKLVAQIGKPLLRKNLKSSQEIMIV